MSTPAEVKNILQSEIKDLKKKRISIPKDAKKQIAAIHTSADSDQKKFADRQAVKKAVKTDLQNAKQTIREKVKAMKEVK